MAQIIDEENCAVQDHERRKCVWALCEALLTQPDEDDSHGTR